MSLTVWCNQSMPESALTRLRTGLAGHRLVHRPGHGQPCAQLATAEIAYGQPPVESLLANPHLRFVQLTSAGYTAFDRTDLREHLSRVGAPLCKSSVVFDEPCAEHALAFMTAWARQLPWALDLRRGERAWPTRPIRERSVLLRGQSVLLVGYGSIAARLGELCRAIGMQVRAVRRKVRGDESVPTTASEGAQFDDWLANADHVVDILPASPETQTFFDDSRFARMKPGAVFYNIGRGTTVDQDALMARLRTGQLAAAWLDVTDPEPLPPEHPLWSTPNCFVTPHVAGGHGDEEDRLVAHFLANLERVLRGEPPIDRVHFAR